MKTLKRSLIVLLSSLMLICVAMAMLPFANSAFANESVTISATMELGASTRLAETAADAGIRYEMHVDTAVYNELTKENSEYEDVVFGMLVAPYETYYSVYPFDNKENLLNYYTWEGDTRENVSGHAKIINMTATALAEYVPTEQTTNGYYYLRASVVDMKNANLLTEYIGIGYIKYNKDNVETYVFAEKNDNVRSMTYVFQKAVDAGKAQEDSAVGKFFLSDDIKNTDTTYSVEYYFEQGDGTFKLDESKTKKTTAKINATATFIDTENKFSGYVYDSENTNNVTTGKVYANGKLTLKAYYKMTAITSSNAGIVSALEGDGTLDLSDMQQGLNVKVTQFIDVDGTVTNINTNESAEYSEYIDISTQSVTVTDGKLSLNGLEGQYVLKGEKADGTVVYTKYFEATSSAMPVWNNLYSVNTTHLKLLNGDPIKTDTNPAPTVTVVGNVGGRTGSYYEVKGNGARFEFSVLPLHSETYYEAYKDYVLSADVYVADYASNVTAINLLAFYNDKKYDGISIKGKWVTYTTIGNGGDKNTVGRYVDSWATLFNGRNFCGGSALAMLGYAANTGSWGGADVTFYFGNVQIQPTVTATKEVATTTTMVDVKDITSYDITNAFTSEDNKTLVNNYSAFTTWTLTGKNNSTNVVSGTGKTINVEGLKRTVYTLNVSVAGVEVFSGEIDFYNSTVIEMFDVLDAVTGKFFAGYGEVSSSVVDITTVEDVAGDRTGNYLKVDVTTNRPIISVKPLHSKGYYEMYSNYTLSFDLFIVNPNDNTKLVQVNVCNFNIGNPASSDKNIAFGEWHTCSNNVSWIIDNYDYLAKGTVSTAFYICDVANAYYDTVAVKNQWSGSNFTCYFGNIIATPATAE